MGQVTEMYLVMTSSWCDNHMGSHFNESSVVQGVQCSLTLVLPHNLPACYKDAIEVIKHEGIGEK